LVAEHVRLLGFGVVQHVLAVHAFDAVQDPLGVGGRLHVFVVAGGAHIVRDDAGEGLRPGGEGHGGRGEDNCNLLFHWIFPFFVLLYWRQAFASRWLIPLLLGVNIGIGFLYKSFALGLPVTLGLAGWYLHQRQYRVAEFLKQDALKVVITVSVAVAMFAMWFVLDPNPQAVW